MTQQDRDGEDDWGSPTDWQRPAQQPPPGHPGWTQPAVNPPPQGYGNVPMYGGQPIYGQPPDHHPALPPHYPQGWLPVAPPNNYLAPAILVTLLCMPLTGIAAIYFSNQVNAKHNVGDLAGALDASNKAKMWCFVSLAAGVVAWLLILGGSNSGYYSGY